MMDPEIRPIISVALCTHNRADLLGSVLDSLCRQAIDPTYYEIIVIDNDSNDCTEEVVSNFSLIHPNVRYCFEASLGHSAARNRGWQEAIGSYVAYIDDDALAPENWLATAMTLIQRECPGLFGGPYYAYYRTPKPLWFKDEYGSSRMGESAGPLGRDEYLSATNIFVRRDLLERVGGFDPAYGGIGRDLGYAEETELQRRIRRTFPAESALYEPSLYVRHLVKPEWLSIKWRMHSYFIMGRYHYHAVPNSSFRQTSVAMTLLRAAAKCALVDWDLLVGVLLRNRTRYPCVQNYWYERTLHHAASLGAYYEHIRSQCDV